MPRSVIVAAVRTPVGRFGSALRSRSAVDLGAVAVSYTHLTLPTNI